MDIELKKIKSVSVLAFKGELTATYAEKVRQIFQEKLLDEKEIVFDMSGLVYLDSTGLGSLIFCLKKTKEKDALLKIAELHNEPAMVFEIMRATRIFSIYPTVSDAIESFSK